MDWNATSNNYQAGESKSLPSITRKAFTMLGEQKRKVAIALFWRNDLAATLGWNRRGAVLISWNDETPQNWNEKTWKALGHLFHQVSKESGKDIALGFSGLSKWMALNL